MQRNAKAPVATPKTPATKTSAKTSAKPASKTADPAVTKSSQVSVKVTPVKQAVRTAAGVSRTVNAVGSKKAATQGVVAKDKAKVKGAAKELKAPKQKLVRDSFTFPQADYLALVGLKKKLLAAGLDAKKGELVRAGISLLAGLDDAALIKALAAIEKLKAGRPAK